MFNLNSNPYKSDKDKIDEEGYIDISPTDKHKISNIQNTGKYILDLLPDTTRSWVVRKNPNYSGNNWLVFASVMSMLFAGVSTYFIYQQSSNKKEIELLNQALQEQSKSFRQLESSLREINHTISSFKVIDTTSNNKRTRQPK